MASGSVSGGSVVWDLDVDDSKLKSKMSSAKATVEDFGGTTKTQGGIAESSFGGIARGALAFVGVASVVDVAKNAVLGSVKAFGDYDSEMGILKQVTGATGVQMQQLGKLAVDLGNDVSLPGISAADAAGAMTELGKAGLGVNDIFAASKGVLSLAKAGQLDVASAASITANALNSFGLAGTQATTVADLLAAGANSSTASVEGMALGLQQVGSGAKQMGVSINDTVTAISLFANAGIQGSDAGTSLKTMFQALASPTQQQSDLMKKLGLDFFDAKGNFIGLEQTAGQLQSRLGKLTVEQKNAALSIIFGSDASRVAGILADQGAAGFDKMSKSVNTQGAAAANAAAANHGIKGSLEALKSGLETVQLQMGQFLAGALKPLVDAASGNLPVALGVVGGAIIGVGTAALIANPGVLAFGASVWAAIAPALPLIAAGAAIGGALVFLQQKFDIFGRAIAFIKPIVTDVIDGFKILWEALTGGDPTVGASQGMMGFAHVMERVELASLAVQGAVKGVWAAIQVMITGDFKGGIFGLKEDSPVVGALIGIHNALKEVRDIVVNNLTAAWNNMVTIATPALKVLGDIFNNIIKPAIQQLVPIFQALLPVLKIIGEVILVVFGAAVVAAIAAIVAPILVVIAIITALSFVIRAVVAVFGAIVSVIGAVIGAIVSVAVAIFSVLKPPLDAIIFVVSAVGQIFFIIFSTIAQVVWTIVSTIAQIIFVVFEAILNFVWNTFLQPILNFFVSVFGAIWGFIVSVIGPLVGFFGGVFGAIWSVISSVVGAIVGFVRSTWGPIRDHFVQPLDNALGAVRGFIGSFLNAGRDIINGIVNGVREHAGDIVDFIKGVCKNALKAVKDFFGIHSPSTVMAEQGKFIMEGLANGIAAGAGAAVAAAQNASEAVAGGFGNLAANGSMTLATSVTGGGSVGGGSGAAAAGGATIIQNNNVYDQVDMDRVTRDLAWRLR